MSNFVTDNLALPSNKTDASGGSSPVANATRKWSANDANRVFQALGDLRTGLTSVNVKLYGAVGDGTTDDTAAIQAAINATQGRVLYLPHGKYKVSSTLIISNRSHAIVGDFGNRNTDGGTEIAYSGTGPCIQIGAEDLINSPNWNSNWYGGQQDQLFSNLWISHSAPDTSSTSGANYKLGAYGIWDWYGGQITLRNVGIEKFEANWVGIQSDINTFDYVTSLYSKWGLYIGPRSDQQTIRSLYSFSCDRALTVDGEACARLESAQIVGNGNNTIAAIEIRRGAAGFFSGVGVWFEHLQNYSGTDQVGMFSIGEVNGYGPGGSIPSPGGTPNTNSVEGCTIMPAFVYTTATGQPFHAKYFTVVGKCHELQLHRPVTQVGSSITNFDTICVVPATQSPTGADTQVHMFGFSSNMTIAQLFQNLGGGSPTFNAQLVGPAGIVNYTNSRYSMKQFGASAGADELRFSQEGQAGHVFISAPQYSSGQTDRLHFSKSIQPGVAASAPASGLREQGDWSVIADPVDGGNLLWVSTGGGTPGTWRRAGHIKGPGGWTFGETTTDANVLNGQFTLNCHPTAFGLLATRSAARTAAGSPAIRGIDSGNTDTTSGNISVFGIQGQVSAARTAGANVLTNIGLEGQASNGDVNLALRTTTGDVSLNTTSGTTLINRSVRFGNELLPGAIGANQNDYSPSNLSDAAVLIISASGAFNITGLATGTAGRMLWVYNNGANNITLTHQDALSTAANRFVGRNGANTVLLPSTGVQLYYSSSTARWLIMDNP